MRISDWSSDVCSSDLWTGDVVKKDDQAALYFLKKAGDQGLKPAQDSYNDIYSQLNPPKNDPLVDEATPTPPSGKYYVQLGAFSILSNATSYWNRIRSEEHTSELQSLMRISYAVFCLKKKNHN